MAERNNSHYYGVCFPELEKPPIEYPSVGRTLFSTLAFSPEEARKNILFRESPDKRSAIQALDYLDDNFNLEQFSLDIDALNRRIRRGDATMDHYTLVASIASFFSLKPESVLGFSKKYSDFREAHPLLEESAALLIS